MASRWANPALLLLILIQTISGFMRLTNGSADSSWLLWVHGVGAYSIALLSFWKGAIIWGTVGRDEPGAIQLGSLVLAISLLGALLTGLIWSFAGPILVSTPSLMTIHFAIAVTVFLLLPLHALAKRRALEGRDVLGRGAFLRLGGVVLGGLALWVLAGRVVDFFNLPGSRRRFTGSYEMGSLTGRFPAETWLFDNPAPVEVSGWKLVIDGIVESQLVLSYDELMRLPWKSLTATIDCTGGWYSEQEWQGVDVGRILEMAGVKAEARSVSFEAVSGYGRKFPVDQARGFLLALKVGAQVLDHGHGFPLRLVAPDQRGFQWVKWLTHIRVAEEAAWLQPPLPLQ